MVETKFLDVFLFQRLVLIQKITVFFLEKGEIPVEFNNLAGVKKENNS